MGDGDDAWRIALSHSVEPAFPAGRDHLGRLSAARSIVPKVIRPRVKLVSGYLVPAEALPLAEVHFDQFFVRRRRASGPEETRQTQAPQRGAAADLRSLQRFRRNRVQHVLGCGNHRLVIHLDLKLPVADAFDSGGRRVANQKELHRRLGFNRSGDRAAWRARSAGISARRSVVSHPGSLPYNLQSET
jgi:hypothetical protein